MQQWWSSATTAAPPANLEQQDRAGCGMCKLVLLLPVTSTSTRTTAVPYAGIIGLVKRSDRIVRRSAQRCQRNVQP